MAPALPNINKERFAKLFIQLGKYGLKPYLWREKNKPNTMKKLNEKKRSQLEALKKYEKQLLSKTKKTK
jgi:hypothetical protein